MRSDDILARADAALGRVNKAYRAANRADDQPYVNRWVKMAIIGAGLALIIAVLSAPFTVFVIGAMAVGVVYAIQRLRPQKTETAVAKDLTKLDLASLPLKTELWLASQRRLLPAAAQSLIDSICTRLKTLASQADAMVDGDPLANGIRRLLAEELPELISDYHKIPPAMRKTTSDGFLPDKQLAQGLIVIDSRLAEINTILAAAPVNKLAIQARYLDLKYQASQE